jgi:hypothetical protein
MHAARLASEIPVSLSDMLLCCHVVEVEALGHNVLCSIQLNANSTALILSRPLPPHAVSCAQLTNFFVAFGPLPLVAFVPLSLRCFWSVVFGPLPVAFGRVCSLHRWSVEKTMDTEIVRLAYARVVELEHVNFGPVSFECGPVTLKMVKITLGIGWLLQDNIFFYSDDYHTAANAFYLNFRASAQPESDYFNVRFGGTDTIVWSVPRFNGDDALKEALIGLAQLLKDLPILIFSSSSARGAV